MADPRAFTLAAPPSDFLHAASVEALLAETSPPSLEDVARVVDEALTLRGLKPEQAAVLLNAGADAEPLIFQAAGTIKNCIYGGRVVLFAPLYLSNLCSNNCLYCSFRRDNRTLERKTLTLDEVAQQVRLLADMGHRRILLESGEVLGPDPMDTVVPAIETIYSTRTPKGSIRRINVNVAATTVENYRRLKASGIGTYQLFQETYHRPTYATMHPSGPKADFDYHLTAMDRAMEAGIDDVGLGVLFGLHDYKFEVLSMLYHAQHLEEAFGVGPHTLSVPRLRPADGVDLVPPHPVSDAEFKRIVAVLRLAVPYTGLILSTREAPELRNELLGLGISQMSAASATQPGGYQQGISAGGQFKTADQRSVDEVVRDICKLGYLPSFCTACYRTGRTGKEFMHLAKPGDIQKICRPNALLTFEEYLHDFASPGTRAVGSQIIAQQVELIEGSGARRNTERLLERVAAGARDVYV